MRQISQEAAAAVRTKTKIQLAAADQNTQEWNSVIKACAKPSIKKRLLKAIRYQTHHNGRASAHIPFVGVGIVVVGVVAATAFILKHK